MQSASGEEDDKSKTSEDSSSLGNQVNSEPRAKEEDLEVTLAMGEDDTISRPPRTSTPIMETPAKELEMNFSSSIFQEHSYHVSFENKLLKSRGFPLSSLMKQNWSESRVSTKNVLRKTSTKSKKIVKQIKTKRKFFTKEQLAVATNILYSSRRVFKMLRNQRLIELPSERTVYRHLQRFKCRPGINSEMKKLLTIFLSSLDPADRICGVLFDEMKLSQLMSWSPRLKTVFKPHKVQINIFINSEFHLFFLECPGCYGART